MTLDKASPRVLVIANPASGAGSTAKKLTDIERALRHHGLAYELVCTSRAGHASEIAASDRAKRADVIAVVGGDGTLNEVVQGYIDKTGEVVAGPHLAMIPSGSGGDFRKTLGLSGSIDEAVARIRFGAPRPCDLGVLHMHDHQGRPIVRSFINIASFGVGGLVDRLVNEGPKWIGGRAIFLLGTVRALATYKNAEVRIKVDGAAYYEGRIFNVAIANGRFFGAGMKIAPHADIGDGRFDVVTLGDLARPEVIALSARIYSGSHLGEHGVTVGSGTVVEAEPIHPWASVLVDVDGEAPGKLPLRASMRKHAVTLRG